jgi:hypothetical protein
MPINLANLTNITGTTSAYNSVPTGGAIIINTIQTNHVYKLGTVIAANKTASAATVTVVVYRNSSSYYTLAYQMSVPGNASIVIVGKDNPVYMMDTSSDVLSAQAGTSNAIDIFASYEDIS